MSRLMRKTAILAKIETTYATDAAPAGAANAILISNATFTFNYNNVDRDLMRAYLGGAEQLVGSRNVTASFDVEIAGSGAAGTAPAWGPLVRACGMAETITASARVEYNPVSATFDSLTIYYSVDGLLHKAIGCRGTMTMGMGEGERPLFKFTFTGIDGGTVAQADPTQTLTAFKPPLVVTDANSGDIKLGGTYATGAITGGTAYPSRGLQLDLGQFDEPPEHLAAQVFRKAVPNLAPSRQRFLVRFHRARIRRLRRVRPGAPNEFGNFVPVAARARQQRPFRVRHQPLARQIHHAGAERLHRPQRNRPQRNQGNNRQPHAYASHLPADRPSCAHGPPPFRMP